MYTVIRQWNRENIENYKEIYVKGSMETLYKRDQKGLYSSGTPNVVGVDIPAEELECPDIVIVVRHAEHRDPKNNDGKSGRLCLPLLL